MIVCFVCWFTSCPVASFKKNRIMEDAEEMLTSALKSDVGNFTLHFLPRGGAKMFPVN